MRIFYEKNGIRVRTSKKEDCDYLKDNLKQEDVKEIFSSHHHTPEEALKLSLEKSLFCATVENGRPIAVFGISVENLLGDKATIWMLSTRDLKKIGKRFLKNSKSFVKYMLEYYPVLENYVHWENKESIKWLRWLGADIEEAEPFGIEKELFHHFTFRRN